MVDAKKTEKHRERKKSGTRHTDDTLNYRKTPIKNSQERRRRFRRIASNTERHPSNFSFSSVRVNFPKDAIITPATSFERFKITDTLLNIPNSKFLFKSNGDRVKNMLPFDVSNTDGMMKLIADSPTEFRKKFIVLLMKSDRQGLLKLFRDMIKFHMNESESFSDLSNPERFSKNLQSHGNRQRVTSAASSFNQRRGLVAEFSDKQTNADAPVIDSAVLLHKQTISAIPTKTNSRDKLNQGVRTSIPNRKTVDPSSNIMNSGSNEISEMLNQIRNTPAFGRIMENIRDLLKAEQQLLNQNQQTPQLPKSITQSSSRFRRPGRLQNSKSIRGQLLPNQNVNPNLNNHIVRNLSSSGFNEGHRDLLQNRPSSLLSQKNQIPFHVPSSIQSSSKSQSQNNNVRANNFPSPPTSGNEEKFAIVPIKTIESMLKNQFGQMLNQNISHISNFNNNNIRSNSFTNTGKQLSQDQLQIIDDKLTNVKLDSDQQLLRSPVPQQTPSSKFDSTISEQLIVPLSSDLGGQLFEDAITKFQQETTGSSTSTSKNFQENEPFGIEDEFGNFVPLSTDFEGQFVDVPLSNIQNAPSNVPADNTRVLLPSNTNTLTPEDAAFIGDNLGLAITDFTRSTGVSLPTSNAAQQQNDPAIGNELSQDLLSQMLSVGTPLPTPISTNVNTDSAINLSNGLLQTRFADDAQSPLEINQQLLNFNPNLELQQFETSASGVSLNSAASREIAPFPVSFPLPPSSSTGSVLEQDNSLQNTPQDLSQNLGTHFQSVGVPLPDSVNNGGAQQDPLRNAGGTFNFDMMEDQLPSPVTTSQTFGVPLPGNIGSSPNGLQAFNSIGINNNGATFPLSQNADPSANFQNAPFGVPLPSFGGGIGGKDTSSAAGFGSVRDRDVIGVALQNTNNNQITQFAVNPTLQQPHRNNSFSLFVDSIESFDFKDAIIDVDPTGSQPPKLIYQPNAGTGHSGQLQKHGSNDHQFVTFLTPGLLFPFGDRSFVYKQGGEGVVVQHQLTGNTNVLDVPSTTYTGN